MAIAFNAESHGNNTEAASLTVSHTAAGDDRYAVITVGTVSNNTTNPVTVSVTYAGNACTRVAYDGRSLGTNRYGQVETWIYADPPTGSQNVVASFSTYGCLSGSMIVCSYTGVDVHGNVGNADGSDTTPTCSVTTTVANAYVAGSVAGLNVGAQTLSPGSGITERADFTAAGPYTNDDQRVAAMDKAVASAGATTFDATLSASANWAISAVELKPVATAGGKPALYYAMMAN